MSKYAENTSVPAEKSRMEIEQTLSRYDADAFQYGWEGNRAILGFRAHNRYIRFELKMPDKNSSEFTEYQRGYSTYRREQSAALKLWEQATRQKWRALALVVKAKLEAVDCGISEFEEEFLANIVMPDNSTVGDWVKPEIEKAYLNGKMPKLLIPKND